MLVFALPILLTLHQAASVPQQLQGAEKIIAAMGGSATGPKDTGAESRKLAAKLRAFGAVCETLVPDDAATQWLALFEEAEKTGASDGGSARSVTPTLAMAVLPPPPAWPAIRTLIEAKTAGLTDRHSVRLRLLAQLLTHDLVSVEASLVTLMGMVKKSPNETYQFDDVLTSYAEMAVGSGDPAMLDRVLTRMVQAVEAHIHVNEDWNGLPELVGEARATVIYRKLMNADPTVLERVKGPESRRIVHRLAIELAPSLKNPMWDFADGLDTADLYPVFAKRWPAQPVNGEPSDAERTRASAKICYALTLEMAGKHEQAVALADDADWFPNAYAQWFYGPASEQPGVAASLYRLMTGVAKKHLDKVQWSALFEAGQATGHLDTVLALAKRRLAMPAPKDQFDLEREYIRNLLAADHVDAAVAEIHGQLRSAQKFKPSSGFDAQRYPVEQLYDDLLAIGRLTARQNLFREGLAGLTKTGRAADWQYGRSTGMANILVAQGRGSEIEESIVKGISASLREYANRNGRQMGSFESSGFPGTPTPYYSGLLLSLAELYQHLDHPADVVSLFQNSPGWGVPDLADLYGWVEDRSDNPSPPLVAAWALSKVGEKDKAVEVLKPVILRSTESDPCYEVMLDAAGSDAIPSFDEALRRNPFVARPLIWKAVALHRAQIVGRPGAVQPAQFRRSGCHLLGDEAIARAQQINKLDYAPKLKQKNQNKKDLELESSKQEQQNI